MAGIPLFEPWADPLMFGAAMLLFVAALLAAGPMRWLAAGPARLLGSISYGVYLIHYPVLLAVSAEDACHHGYLIRA